MLLLLGLDDSTAIHHQVLVAGGVLHEVFTKDVAIHFPSWELPALVILLRVLEERLDELSSKLFTHFHLHFTLPLKHILILLKLIAEYCKVVVFLLNTEPLPHVIIPEAPLDFIFCFEQLMRCLIQHSDAL